MKRLLRTIADEQYLLPSGKWTTNPNEALNFKPVNQEDRFPDVTGYRGVEVASIAEPPRVLNSVSPDTLEGLDS